MGNPDTTLYDVMSITKAVIGLMYIDVDGYEDLLNMEGYIENWDYDDFRRQVKQNTNLKKYALNRIKKTSSDFSYCNLAYQVLASEMKDIAFKFGEFVDRPVVKKTRRWVYGNGWKWEHCNSQALGPHGLHITKEIGNIIGIKAKPLLKLSMGIPLKEGWLGYGKNVLEKFWHGWFIKDKMTFAIGYVSQTIAIKTNKVEIDFYIEDWDNPRTENRLIT